MSASWSNPQIKYKIYVTQGNSESDVTVREFKSEGLAVSTELWNNLLEDKSFSASAACFESALLSYLDIGPVVTQKPKSNSQWVSVIISQVCVSSHFSLRKYFNQTFRFNVSFMGLFIPLIFALNPKGRIRRPELWVNILEGFSMTLAESSLMWRRTDEDWEVKLRQLDYFTMWGWTLVTFICSPAAWKRTADTGCYIVHTSVCQIKKNLRGEVSLCCWSRVTSPLFGLPVTEVCL